MRLGAGTSLGRSSQACPVGGDRCGARSVAAAEVCPPARKDWLFCWTEIGAKYVGIFQSLLVTCRLQGVDPYTYLVDVLQRVESHPASEIANLTRDSGNNASPPTLSGS